MRTIEPPPIPSNMYQVWSSKDGRQYLPVTGSRSIEIAENAAKGLQRSGKHALVVKLQYTVQAKFKPSKAQRSALTHTRPHATV